MITRLGTGISSIREGVNADDPLTLTLSLSGQFVYANLDVEDI